MAGEYQLAQRKLDEGLDAAREDGAMDEVTFARALMHQLLEHNKKTRTKKDIVGELEQYIVDIADDGDQLIARGC